jgi:hypothetical protein
MHFSNSLCINNNTYNYLQLFLLSDIRNNVFVILKPLILYEVKLGDLNETYQTHFKQFILNICNSPYSEVQIPDIKI